MSQRELRALDKSSVKPGRTRSEARGRGQVNMSEQDLEQVQPEVEREQQEDPEAVGLRLMEENEALKQQLEASRQEVEESQSLAELTDTELQRVKGLLSECQREIEGLSKTLEWEQTRGELSQLKALEGLRQEHQLALDKERSLAERERGRLEDWIADLKEGFSREKEHLLERIADLERTRSREPRPATPIGEDRLWRSPRRGEPQATPRRSVTTAPLDDPTLSGTEVSGEGISSGSTGPDVYIPVSREGATRVPAVPVDVVDTVTEGGALVSVSTGGGRELLQVQSTPSTPPLVVSAPVTTTVVEVHAAPPSAQPEETGRQPIPSTVHPAMSSARTEGTGIQHVSSSEGSGAQPATTSSQSRVLPVVLPVQAEAQSLPSSSQTTSIAQPPTQPVLSSSAQSAVTLTTETTTTMSTSAPAVTAGRVVSQTPPVSKLVDNPTPNVVDTMAKLLQAQVDAMAAQARASAVQHLPALSCYTGEEKDVMDDGFERWLERFEERSKIACWTPEHQLYQLKLHLEGTARDVFRMLPETERDTMAHAVVALKQRFRPVDIEELRGLEFHRHMQGTETIKQLGITIQRLGRKAFPSTAGKEFDRLLKGRFYQALYVKWQRKLGPPKASESFYELYDRARALEEQEKQYAASSVIHQSDNSRRSDQSKMSTGSQPPAGTLPPSTPTTQATVRSEEIGSRQLARRCHHCKETGHLRRDCPRRQEALGRSSTNTVTAQQNPAHVEDLTEQELERLLAERRLQRERGSVTNPEVSHANTITATAAHAKAVGAALETDVSIEGVSVRCLIDTGAQSTIISRATLRKVAQLLKLQGRPPPSLELPRVKLLGKGKGDYRELTITAQVDLTYMLDGRSAIIPTFIQPDSEQDCLLGANALPLLGITVSRSNGDIIMADSQEMTQSDSQETQSDSQVTQSDSRETRSDSRETRSDSRETRSDSRETRSDSRETRSDSRETRSDSQETTQSDSQETQSDSQVTQSDSQETRSDSQETRSDSQETRSGATVRRLRATVRRRLGSTVGRLGATVGRLGATVRRLGATVRRLGATVRRLGVTVRRLGATVRRLGATVRRLGATVRRLGATVRRLGATVRSLGATVRSLGPTVRRLGPTVRSLGATVRSLGPTVRRLGATVRRLGATVRRLGATVRRLGATVRSPQ